MVLSSLHGKFLKRNTKKKIEYRLDLLRGIFCLYNER